MTENILSGIIAGIIVLILEIILKKLLEKIISRLTRRGDLKDLTSHGIIYDKSMKAKFEEDTIFDIKGIAEVLGVTTRTVRRMIDRGDISKPMKKLGNKDIWSGKEVYKSLATPAGMKPDTSSPQAGMGVPTLEKGKQSPLGAVSQDGSEK